MDLLNKQQTVQRLYTTKLKPMTQLPNGLLNFSQSYARRVTVRAGYIGKKIKKKFFNPSFEEPRFEGCTSLGVFGKGGSHDNTEGSPYYGIKMRTLFPFT